MIWILSYPARMTHRGGANALDLGEGMSARGGHTNGGAHLHNPVMVVRSDFRQGFDLGFRRGRLLGLIEHGEHAMVRHASATSSVWLTPRNATALD